MGCVTGMLLLLSAIFILTSAAALLFFQDLLKAAVAIVIALFILWVGFEIFFSLLVCNVPSLLLPLKLGAEMNSKFLSKPK